MSLNVAITNSPEEIFTQSPEEVHSPEEIFTQSPEEVHSETQSSYFTGPKVASYFVAALATGIGGYELTNILNPSPEALRVLAQTDMWIAVYAFTGISLGGGVGFFARECLNGCIHGVKSLRRLTKKL